ncbi:hypothetical protein, partial [Sinorhizobium fredii]|uniref:hypothetical protein n=1 Tax=Rhizobium fredii TaxID=380 RepID=UPI001AF01B7C
LAMLRFWEGRVRLDGECVVRHTLVSLINWWYGIVAVATNPISCVLDESGDSGVIGEKYGVKRRILPQVLPDSHTARYQIRYLLARSDRAMHLHDIRSE